MKMSQIKKDIARMKTILREREFGAAPAAAPATPEKGR
jgi:hypothetical protein